MDLMRKYFNSHSLIFILPVLMLAVIYLTSLYSYLLFHSLSEIFSIVIACGIFIIAWNSHHRLKNRYILFWGIAFLFTSILDIIHMLAYKGMGIFSGPSTNLASQIWISARYLQSLSLLVAPLFFRRKFNPNLVVAGYIIAITLILTSIFYWQNFPVCYIEGAGLTVFKKISEYIICLILLASLVFLHDNRREFERVILRQLEIAIFLTIAAELAFSLYIDPYGLFNLLGHMLKILSFYLFYLALVDNSLRKPFTILSQDLRLAEERYRTVTENMQGGVLLFEQNRGVYANKRAADITGFSIEKLLKITLTDFPAADDKSNLIQIIHDKTSTGVNSANIECWLTQKSGERRYIRARYLRISEENQPPRFLIILNDITELKTTELERQELYKNEHELRQKLEYEIKKRVEYTHALVHELRTPLTPVMTSSEMLTEIITEGIPARLVNNIYHGAMELNQRIEELLELARIEVGTFKLSFQPVNLLTLLAETVNQLTPVAIKNQQILTSILPESLPVIKADADRLRQVLMNLINNALKHSPAGTRIEVSVRQDDKLLVVEVKDTGKGISDELQKRIFEPYFRVENDRANLSGLGLGLPIAQKIVELHGGQIWVKSQPGKGSTFGFSIPVIKPD
jgi:PAS domain S-box-containing protein